MRNRPTSITITGWILVVLSAFWILNDSYHLIEHAKERTLTPIEAWLRVQIVFALIVSAIDLVCAIGVLRGKSWSRFTYVLISLAGIIFNFISYGSLAILSIPAIIVFLVFTYFLFTPTAKRFFVR